ncbi:MAG TPA: lipoate--protein ligase family protein [Bacteroidota bacterium]|nr:lipoate--protein ligase family protein [Bacteroidota bacterium]
MDWQFLDTGFHAGAYNMDLDEKLVRSLADGSGRPTIRVYGWNPPAISLGWNQRMEEIDAAQAAADGIDVVRRPTGGRAILHSEELTYSVTITSGGKNVLAVYNDISRALVCGLRSLGADVSLEKVQPHFPTLYQSPSSSACFSSSARYEIQAGGRKLVGSAQRRFAGPDGHDVVLQHGSLLLGGDHKRLVRYLRTENEPAREKLAADMETKTIDLSGVVGRPVSFEEAADAVRTGFEEAWGIRVRRMEYEPASLGGQS